MYPVQLKANNFLSFEMLSYDFKNTPVLIQGENRTQEDQESNGSGKSAIQEMIYYSIARTSLLPRPDKELIRWGCEAAELLLSIYCPIRKETLTINRVITQKGSRLSIALNDTPVEYGTIKEGDSYILSWLDISVADLKNYFIISEENYLSFFRCSNTDKLALISRFTDIECLDKVKPNIEKEIEELSKDLNQEVNKLSEIKGRIQVHEELLLKEEVRDIEKERIDFIVEKEAEIEKMKTSIVDVNNKIKLQQHAIKLASEAYTEKIEQCKETKSLLFTLKDNKKAEQAVQEASKSLSEANRKRREAELDRKKEEKEMRDNDIILSQLKNLIAGMITCPACGHKFSLSTTKTTKEIEEEAANAEANKESFVEIIAVYTEMLADLDEQLNAFILEKDTAEAENEKFKKEVRFMAGKVDQLQIEAATAQSRDKQIKENISLFEKQIVQMESYIQTCVRQIESKRSEKFESRVGYIKENIRVLDVKIKEQQDVIDDKEAEIFNKGKWIVRFKEFKMFIALRQIEIIQSYANYYLSLMKSDLRIQIEGYKLDSKKNVKEEITAYIVRDNQAKLYWTYSAGERCRVEIAMILSIQQMINNTNKFNGLHLLVTDEVFESLDATGVVTVAKSLQVFDFPILYTTHVINQFPGIETMKVIKENNISRIENE